MHGTKDGAGTSSAPKELGRGAQARHGANATPQRAWEARKDKFVLHRTREEAHTSVAASAHTTPQGPRRSLSR